MIIDVINARDNMLFWLGWDSAEVHDSEKAEVDALRGVELLLKKHLFKAIASW